MPRLIFSLLLLVLAAVSFSPSALGAPPPATGQAVPASVADAVRRGDKARKAGRWGEALEAYRAALEEAQRAGIPAQQRDAIVGEIGACEAALGKHREAARNLHRGLSDRVALGAERKGRFEQAFLKIRDEVGALYIGTSPADAEVFVDGKSIGAGAPKYVIFVEPGSHTIRTRHAEYVQATVTVDVAGGASGVVAMRMDRLPPCKRCPAAAQKASPAAPRRPATVAAPRGGTEETLQRVGIVTAAGCAVLGAALTISAAVVDDTMEEKAAALGPGACRGDPFTEACKGLQDAKEARDLLHGVGVASLIAGGAIGAATLISFQWAPAGRSSARVHAAPAVGPGRAGLVVTTAW